jgi:hypothetical protein
MEELRYSELATWPRETLYALVPSMTAVDRALKANATNGRSAIKAIRELLAPVVKNGAVVITSGNRQRMIPQKWFAELVFQTRSGEHANAATLSRLGSRCIDLVKVLGGDATQPCTAYAGQVFSISGKSAKYPPLSGLEKTGAMSHIACQGCYVAFIEGLSG